MRDWRRPGAGKTRGLASRAPACRWVTAGRAGGAGRARGAVAKVGAYAAARERRTAPSAPWRAPACAAARHTGVRAVTGPWRRMRAHVPGRRRARGRSSVPAGRGTPLPWCGVPGGGSLPGGRGRPARPGRGRDSARGGRSAGAATAARRRALPGRAGCCSTGAATAGSPAGLLRRPARPVRGAFRKGGAGAGRGERRGARACGVPGQRRVRRWRATAAAVPPTRAPTPAAAGMPTFAALRPVR